MYVGGLIDNAMTKCKHLKVFATLVDDRMTILTSSESPTTLVSQMLM